MRSRRYIGAALTLLLIIVVPPTSVHGTEQKALTPQLAERLGRILSKADEDVEWTLQQLADLAERRRTNPQDLRYILRQRAALLMQEDQLDTAAIELTDALRNRDPEYAPELHFLLGQVLLILDEPEDALEQLNIWATHAQPADPAGLFLIGYSYVRLERFAEAADALERAIAGANTPRSQWIEILAYAYARLDRTADALRLLEDLITQRPAETRWWRQLATVYLLIDDVPRGAAGMTITAELKPLGIADARHLAHLFAYLDMPADAAYLLQAALKNRESSPSHEDLMLLAELWILAREFEAAVVTLQRAAALGADGEAQLMLGHLYLQREDYHKAATTLDAAIAAYGEETPSQAFYLLAVAFINLEDFDAARGAIVRLEADADFAPRAARLRGYLEGRPGA